jgi:hypothetical protein
MQRAAVSHVVHAVGVVVSWWSGAFVVDGRSSSAPIAQTSRQFLSSSSSLAFTKGLVSSFASTLSQWSLLINQRQHQQRRVMMERQCRCNVGHCWLINFERGPALPVEPGELGSLIISWHVQSHVKPWYCRVRHKLGTSLELPRAAGLELVKHVCIQYPV